jgi:hypothetical protein
MHTPDRVRQILSTRELTLYQVSQRSAKIFGDSSLYFIPQRLYHELAVGALTPNLHQLAAFSHISNYRLVDWLAVFGFHLDDIPKLQLLVPRRRTLLLDSSVYDQEQRLPWFAGRLPEPSRPAIAPLGQFLKRSAPMRAKELLDLNKKRFLYVRIGHEDKFAFPSLAPNSVARIDARSARDLLSSLAATNSKNMFLVESGLSLYCGHLRRTAKDKIMLCSTLFPFTQKELRLDKSVRIVGVVDAELRPLRTRVTPDSSPRARILPKALVVRMPEPRADLQQLIRISRMRVGISFREASRLSRWIAGALADPMYFAAVGTLSDYEKIPSPIRHIQKILSLCILYCIDFQSFVRATGIPVDFLGKDPMPDQLIPRASYRNEVSIEVVANRSTEKPNNLLSTLIDEWEELPLFMVSALPILTGVKALSVADIFWVGRNPEPLHPCLVGASLLAVNRRVKTPTQTRASTAWEQPLYVLLLRGGGYLCGPCELRRGVLFMQPHSESPRGSIQFKNGIDAEVIGQVTAIARRFS